MVRDLVSEVMGMAPYEKRLLDMLKTGGVSSEKRMYKFAKRRVNSMLSLHYIQFLIFFLKFSWAHTRELSKRGTK